MPPKYVIQWGPVWHKSRLELRDFYRKYGKRTPPFMAYEPPPFMPCEPFLLGVGVVFNLLTLSQSSSRSVFLNWAHRFELPTGLA